MVRNCVKTTKILRQTSGTRLCYAFVLTSDTGSKGREKMLA